MKRFLIVFFVFLGIIVLAAAGGIFYLYTQWPPSRVFALANDFLEKNYYLRLETSRAEIDWLRGLSLQNPKLVDRDGTVLLEANEITATYDLLGLFQKTLRFSRLTIRGLYTTSKNIEGIVKRFSSSGKKSSSASFGFEIRQMVFVDSQVVYNSIPVNINVTWNLGSLGSTASYNGSLVSMYGKASFQGRGKTIGFSLEDFNVAKFFPALNDIFIQKVGGDLFLQGNQWAIKGSSLTVLFQSNSVSSPRYTVLYDTKKQTVLISDTRVKYGSSELFISNLFYSLPQKMAYGVFENVLLQLQDVAPGGEGSIEGNLRFRYEMQEVSQLDGNLTLNNVKYGPLMAKGDFTIDGFTLNGNATVTIGNNMFEVQASPIGRQGLSLVISADRVDLKDLMLQKWPQTKSKSSSSGGNLPLEKIVESLPLAVEVKIPAVVYDAIAFDDLSFSLQPRVRSWVIEKMGFDFLRGQVRGQAVIAGEYIRGNLSFSDIKLHELNETLLKEGRSIYGTLRGSIEYQLPLTNLLAGYMSMNFVVDKPELRGFVLQNQISELLYNLPLERLSFDSITVSGEMREKRLFLRNLLLDSYDIQVSAPTTLAFEKQLVDTEITLSVSKDYLSGLPNVAQLFTAGYSEGNRLVFRLKVTNTLEKPKVVLLPSRGQ
ncbi:AsmA family protein [Thermospira aquatica]|uniref:AsmA-like C-terminal domain-containing protein n=1 Tax=Thermospira aquatica TaxID=2828656 RepID=A0AAX3BEK9_9SPIR|nr:hypothetical protein [Thermospira aquatica]URA10661.1 hypothetical protein KDW03_02320 [Thermospira aquatica]